MRDEILSNECRLDGYLRQSGRREPTARQARRLRCKANEARRIERGFPSRPGRLRRRFDAVEDRKVKAQALFVATLVRARLAQRKGLR